MINRMCNKFYLVVGADAGKFSAEWRLSVVYLTPEFVVNGRRVPVMSVLFSTNELDPKFRRYMEDWSVLGVKTYMDMSFKEVRSVFACIFKAHLKTGVCNHDARRFSDDRYGTEARRIYGLGGASERAAGVNSMVDDELVRLDLAAALLGAAG